MTLYDVLIDPFVAYGFMRRALVACLALAIGSAPIGVLLVLRRMSLMGDALSHAVLPGAAIAYLLSGLSVWAMGVGGLIAGLSVALLSGAVSRATPLKEDASFAGFYLGSLALGVMIVSLRGSNVDLLHVLFGSILAIDATALYLTGVITTLSLLVLALIYRPLILEAFDPAFLRAVAGARVAWYHFLFLTLLVLNLVAGFQVLGTLMTVGLMMVPAASSRFWAQTLVGMMVCATLLAALSGLIGLLLSYHAGLPSGPSIVFIAAVLYCISIIVGRYGGVHSPWAHRPHLKA